MSDITSAFEILINANPDNAVAAFGTLCDSMNQAKESTGSWQEDVTGLNQAFELVSNVGGMVVGAVGRIGEAFIAAGEGTVELIKAGGEFAEQQRQFDTYTRSLGEYGREYASQVQGIAGNTIGIQESMTLATKALTAGLRGQDYDDFFSYIKRFSESTGADFEQLADKMVTSMAKGRLGVVKELGIIVNDGDTVSDVVARMSASLDKFGDTGFNMADTMKSLNVSWSDFLLNVGAALNDAPTLGRVMTDLAAEVMTFVDEFDYSKLTQFFDTGLAYVEAFAKSFGLSVDTIGSLLEQFATAESGSAKEFFKYINDLIFGAVESVGSALNSTIDLLQGINAGNWFGKIIDGFVQATMTGASAVVDIIQETMTLALDGAKSVFGMMEGLANNHPDLAKLMGIDPTQFAEASAAIDGVKNNLNTAAAGMQTVFEGASGVSEKIFQNINTGLDAMKVNTTDIAAKHEEINKAIDNINYSPIASNSATAATGVRNAFAEQMETVKEDVAKATRATAAATKEAYVDVGKTLTQSITASFGNVQQSSKAYLDALKNDPFYSDSQKAEKARQLLEDQTDAQDRMITALEKMAATKGDTKINVDIDGTDGAIKELVAKVIEECVIKARSEGILVAGI